MQHIKCGKQWWCATWMTSLYIGPCVYDALGTFLSNRRTFQSKSLCWWWNSFLQEDVCSRVCSREFIIVAHFTYIYSLAMSVILQIISEDQLYFSLHVESSTSHSFLRWYNNITTQRRKVWDVAWRRQELFRVGLPLLSDSLSFISALKTWIRGGKARITHKTPTV